MTPHKRTRAHPDPPTASKRRKPSAPVVDLTADDHPASANAWVGPWQLLTHGLEYFKATIAASRQPSASPASKGPRADGRTHPSPRQSGPVSLHQAKAFRNEYKQLKQQHLELRKAHLFEKMNARAANLTEPPKPQRILELEERMKALQLRLKTGPKQNGVAHAYGTNGSGGSASSSAPSGSGYPRKKPMGTDRHKLAIARRDADTLANLQMRSTQTTSAPRARAALLARYEDEDDGEAPEAEDDLLEQRLYAERLDSGLRREQAKDDATSRPRASQRASRIQIGRSAASIAGLSALDRPSSFPPASPYLPGAGALAPARPAQARRTRSDVDHAIATAKKTLEEPLASTGSAFERFEEIARELKVAEEAAQALEGAKPKRRKFPKELPPADAARVKAILKDSRYETSITGAAAANRDLRRLQGQGWLNDELINFVGVLINRRSDEADKTGERGDGGKRLRKAFVFNTNFFTWYGDHGFAKVKRWTRRFDTFDKDIIIVPINHNNNHWCCAAINIKLKRFEYYDSFGTPAEFVYARLRDWLAEEHRNRKKSEIDLSDWTNYWLEDVPQQNNISDCGVFTCMFMESLSREVDFFDFTQKNMPYLRNKMILQIDKHDLLDVEPWV
ncbi:hypothetical protein JCM3770_000483 [Rhodotorula araucariae]